jgi:integrase
MENKPKFHPNPKLKLMDQVREVLRYHHYADRTEQTYCQWILRYIHHFGAKTHPRYLGAKDVEAFLSHLATEGKVSGATQRQALNALVFLYRNVLDMPLDGEMAPARSKRVTRPPTVLTQAEVQRLLAAIEGKNALMTKLLYGSGLRNKPGSTSGLVATPCAIASPLICWKTGSISASSRNCSATRMSRPRRSTPM